MYGGRVTMLSKLVVEGFRSIRDLTLELSPLTALVGPNGSGKSTVLAALDPQVSLSPTWRHQVGEPVTIRLLESDGFDQHRPNPDFFAQQLRIDIRAVREAQLVERATRVNESGSNLVNAISSLSRENQTRLAREFAARIPSIRDVDVVPTSQGRHSLRFHDRWSSAEFAPSEVSDGTLLMLAFLTLKYQSQRPDIITIEEPERGLHPYLLGELVKFLRELTEGPNGIQVVLATHSAELLEHLKPEEVRFLSRSPDDGNVVVRTIDTSEPDWPRYFREYSDSLGSAWLSGGLGGTPQTH